MGALISSLPHPTSTSLQKQKHGSSTAAGAEASLVWPSGVERCLTLPEGFLGYRGLKFWHLSGFHINHMNHHQTTMVGCQPTVFQRWWQYIYQSAGFLCSFRFTVFWAVSLTIRNLQDSTSLFLLAKLHGFSPTQKMYNLSKKGDVGMIPPNHPRLVDDRLMNGSDIYIYIIYLCILQWTSKKIETYFFENTGISHILSFQEVL